MLSFLKKKSKSFLQVDIHSHLIPAIDDGVKTLESSIDIIKQLSEAGIKKIITTPHIAKEFYPNDQTTILGGLEKVKKKIEELVLRVELEAAAEYYMDQHLLNKLRNNEQLLTFGNKYLLFETAFLNKPPFFDEVIFEMFSNGYQPIFAHPERYEYLADQPEFLFELKKRNVLLQVNAGSLIGYYSPRIKKMAKWMMKNELIDFLGSDIHHERHLSAFLKYRQSKDYQKLQTLRLLNDELL